MANAASELAGELVGEIADSALAAAPRDPRQSTADDTWSISGLAAAIGRTIAQGFGDEVWVRGEIVGYSQAASGHIYFTLIEPGTGADRRGARIRVALFKGRQRAVNRSLADAGWLKLDDGIEVRIRAAVEYYQGGGQVQLIMSGVDPHFTLGVLAADRERTLAELAAAGLLRRNAEAPMPLVPLRVGLITAARSAAYADFMHELAASGYAFTVTLCDARVQGATAEADLIGALHTLGEADVDVIALVRGGGDRTDLMAFDLASVAVTIAKSPVPVFCGIGHEIDESVADRVAHTSAKTPTACAAAVVERVEAFENRLGQAALHLDGLARRRTASEASRLAAARGELGLLAERRLSGPRTRLSEARSELGLLAERRLSRPRARLGEARLKLAHHATRHVTDARARLAAATSLVAAVGPQRTLARGFSITRAADGSVVRDAPEPGARIVTQSAAATFASVVETSEQGDAG